MHTFVRVINSVNLQLGRFIKYGLYIMLLSTFWEIIARYVFRSPTNWSNELVAYLFASWVFLGGGYTLLRDRHVRMDTLYRKVSSNRNSRLALDTVIFLIIFGFSITLFWFGAKVAWESIKIQEISMSDWGPPLYPYKSTVPIGAFFLALQALAKYVEDITAFLRAKV